MLHRSTSTHLHCFSDAVLATPWHQYTFTPIQWHRTNRVTPWHCYTVTVTPCYTVTSLHINTVTEIPCYAVTPLQQHHVTTPLHPVRRFFCITLIMRGHFACWELRPQIPRGFFLFVWDHKLFKSRSFTHFYWTLLYTTAVQSVLNSHFCQ